MPPRIRTRASKALKENIDAGNKFKSSKNNTKVPRKALADKTNSASDDTSVETYTKEKVEVRPRRDRRIPTRFEESSVLTNLSNNSKNKVTTTPKNKTLNSSVISNISHTNITPGKNEKSKDSPLKTPSKVETSLVVNRPRRICRLPSRFEDHSVSPSKYIPIQPANASTPKPTKGKPQTSKENNEKQTRNLNTKSAAPSTRSAKTAALREKKKIEKSSPDSNNNAKNKVTKAKKTQPKPPSPKKINPQINSNTSIRKFFNRTGSSPQVTPTKISPKPTNNKKIKVGNNSFKVLGGTKNSQEKNPDDIYEFTFDPDEEPPVPKKKRKKPVIKNSGRVTKPKTAVTYKSIYDQNISKALSALKKAIKPLQPTEPQTLPQIQETSDETPDIPQTENIVTNNLSTVSKENHLTMNDTGKASVYECNYPSIRVEDIAADIEPSIEHHNDINYSPVNSPRPITPGPSVNLDPKQCPEKPIHSTDPLNLQEDLSFFDDVPVASSSMNVSVRHPLASPWRVEFGSLPIKWHSNTYVKPNMTPAVESSFICSEDSNKRKHVYTNMVPEATDPLPQIVPNTPNLVQTSIISFIKEVAERKAKKKRGRSVSPTKASAEMENINTQKEKDSSNKHAVSSNNTSEEVSGNDQNLSNEKENSAEGRKTRKRKNDENISSKPAKSPRKPKDKDCTYFGFDDSENQENVSPTEGNVKGRSLRSKSRAVLQEVNGPSRAALPVAAKSKTATSSEAVNRVFDELKSAADAPLFPDKNVNDNVTNVENATFNEDSQSVHLFEDIELIHHLKPTRKSYGKPKKVTFRQASTSDSDSQAEAVAVQSDTSFEDDLADLTFEVPNVEEKKKTKKKPKKQMSKKEEKEAEEWAAGFNSMCEEIEEFPLVLE